MDKPTRIVIVGGGYTGIWTYKHLRRTIGGLIKQGKVHITVIAPKPYHSFHGFTAEALCGILSIVNRQSPLRMVMPNARIVLGNAERINLAEKTVTVKLIIEDVQQDIPYDHLVLANGSYDTVESVPGMMQHGFSLKAPGGVQATRNHLVRMIEFADAIDDPQQIKEALGIVVGGGGFAGVEMAANIAEWLHDLRKIYPVLTRYSPRVVLVHSGHALISQLRPQYDHLADYATTELRKWGIEIKLSTRLTEVGENTATLSDGTVIPTKTVISTIGQRTTILAGTESLPRSEKNLIIADAYLHVQGQSMVWTGGDTAQVMHVSGQPCPANALWAIMHGVTLGRNLGRTILGKPLEKFSYRGLGQSASLGLGKGSTELYGGQYTGWIGWLLRFFFFIYFVPSRRQMVRIVLDWLTFPFLGRYRDMTALYHQNPLSENAPAAIAVPIPANPTQPSAVQGQPQ
jgi:NADH dehydrogenase